MEYRLLGGSGLKVPVLSFGTATFGGKSGTFFGAWGSTDVAEAARLVDMCLDAGANLFDSADSYSRGDSEEILGKAIAGVVIAAVLVGAVACSAGRGDGDWQRSLFAPRSSELTPTARAGAKLKIWMLAVRLQTLAERMVRELEQTPGADLDKLMQALQVLKMARLEAQGRRVRRKLLSRAETGHDRRSRDEAVRAALKDLHRGGVDIDRAPPHRRLWIW